MIVAKEGEIIGRNGLLNNPITHIEAAVAICTSKGTDKEVKVWISNKIVHIKYDEEQPVLCTMTKWLSIAKVHHLRGDS